MSKITKREKSQKQDLNVSLTDIQLCSLPRSEHKMQDATLGQSVFMHGGQKSPIILILTITVIAFSPRPYPP